MDIKIKIKNCLYAFHPLAIMRRAQLRKRLQNTTPSLFVPNCMGGMLLHDLGIQFRSPMVNLMMTQPDFVRMICQLPSYLNQEFKFFKSSKLNIPCAHLGDVTVHFTHYDTEEEASTKWQSRCKRIDYNNMFIVAIERDGLTKQDIEALGKLNVRGLLVFTAHDYPDIPYAYHVPSCVKDGVVHGILKRYYYDDHKLYESLFDFVGWFNEANGSPYDISKFKKR